jgi:hypothetical protein
MSRPIDETRSGRGGGKALGDARERFSLPLEEDHPPEVALRVFSSE